MSFAAITTMNATGTMNMRMIDKNMNRTNKMFAIFACVVCFVCFGASVALAIETPGARQDHPIALVGGTIHTVTNGEKAGTLLFDHGKIVALGLHVDLPENAQQIDTTGSHVYPGLIDAISAMGLVEIDAVRATVDRSEVGAINPNVNARIAFNPDSEMIPVTRANGVLVANSVPRGRFVFGQSAAMQLDGWNAEDMTLRAVTGLHLDWPNITEPSDIDKARNERLRELAEWLSEARAYVAARDADDSVPRDARLAAFVPVVKKEVRLFVHADAAVEIRSAVAFAAEHDVLLTIVGGGEAESCAKLLKRHRVPVVIEGTHRLPRYRHAAYDGPFTLPHRLQQSGVRYCLSSGGRFAASNVRNLPYQAGMAAAFGLSRDEALKSVTIYPARILGVANRVGSLEAGKDATLVVASGDILEISTEITHAWIAGRSVSLNNRHRRLYEKFRTKIERREQN